MLFTPEMSGMIDKDRTRSAGAIRSEDADIVLASVCRAAAGAGIWVHLGSLAIALPSGRRANRSYVIDDNGHVQARYDKIHLFDVDLPDGQSWRESAVYDAGNQAIVAGTPIGCLGLSVCYDLRFPALYAALSSAGADVLSIPSAFTVPTGKAHWHVLMRARAIENASFVIAAAQTGIHEDGRETYGHSLVIDPWGTVLLDMGETPGVGIVDIDPAAVGTARTRIPVLAHRKPIDAPASACGAIDAIGGQA